MNRKGFRILLVFLALGSHTTLKAQEPEFKPKVERRQLAIPLPRIAPGGESTSGQMAVPLDAARPFLAIGVTWKPDAGQSFTIYLRGSNDGETWSEWREVLVDHDAGTPDATGGMVTLDAGTKYWRYRLVSRAGISPNEIRFSFFSPGETPGAVRENFLSKMRESKELQAGPAPKPPVVLRAEWGVPAPPPQPPLYTVVTHLIVHHTVNNNDSPDWAAVVRSIWNFHVNDRQYNDIGYNYLIDPNGVIYEGRGGGDNVQGAHFSGVNGGTMGVALLGTFTGIEPSGKAMESLRKLLAWKADQRALVPFGASPHSASGLILKTVSGHRDGPGATECPGGALYALLPRLRAEVHNEIAGAAYVTAVNAASYAREALAGESIVAAFGLNLATAELSASGVPLPESLAGSSVKIIDQRQTEFTAPLFYVSPQQVNLILPAGIVTGPATILVNNGNGLVSAGSINLATVAPALFTANASGEGVPAAQLLRIKADNSFTYEPISSYDPALKQYVPITIDFGPVTDQVFLVAFGTGMRYRSSLGNVLALIGGSSKEVLFVGVSPDYVGLDQVNVRLTRDLIGRGEVVFELTVDGKSANPVILKF